MDPRLFCAELSRILTTQALSWTLPVQADGKEVQLVWSDNTLSLTVDGSKVSDEATAIAMFREMMR
jgi:hypothetical protein